MRIDRAKKKKTKTFTQNNEKKKFDDQIRHRRQSSKWLPIHKARKDFIFVTHRKRERESEKNVAYYDIKIYYVLSTKKKKKMGSHNSAVDDDDNNGFRDVGKFNHHFYQPTMNVVKKKKTFIEHPILYTMIYRFFCCMGLRFIHCANWLTE